MTAATHRISCSTASPFRSLVAAAVLFTAAACGGKQVDTTIPVDEARLLNSEISSTYVRTANLVQDTVGLVEGLARFPDGITPADVDVDLLRHVMEACFTEPVRTLATADLEAVPRAATAEPGPEHAPLTRRGEVGRIHACNPARMLALESYIQVLDSAKAAYVVDRVLTVDVVRANVKDVLVAQLDDLDVAVRRTEGEVLRLRELASERRALAQASSQTPEERRQTEVDFERITQELDQIETVLQQVSADATEWRRLRRSLVDRAAEVIAGLGTP
jgi:hypothetical protein